MGMRIDFDMVNMIIELLISLLLTVLCLVAGISNFKKIYPTRYGKKHIELEGNVVIIKRGKYNYETLAWLYMLVLGLFCLVATIIETIWFIITYL